MEGVEIINHGAGALSTYGLYAICAALTVLSMHLYKRLNELEIELRNSLVKQAEKITAYNEELKRITEQTQEVIKANTEAFKDVSEALRRK